ncbi:MAG: DUF2281 domain-containing protein [Bacteroidota bacterium]
MTEIELRRDIEQKLPFLGEKTLQELKDHLDDLLSQEEATALPKKKRQFGFRKGALKYMAADFNEPLEVFKEYMPK